MIEKIEKINPPKWLMSNDFEFDHLNVIKDSLFFPQSNLNIYPVNVFLDNVYSFIYSDFEIERSRFLGKVTHFAFTDFKIIHHSQPKYSQFDYLGVEETVGGDHSLFDINNHPFKRIAFDHKLNEKPHDNYFDWMIFENSSGKRFSFLYISAEPISVYYALYTLTNSAPKILVLENLARRIFENWVIYADEDDLFADLMFNRQPKFERKKLKTPKYFVVSDGVEKWKAYPRKLCDINDYFSIWEKYKRIRVSADHPK